LARTQTVVERRIAELRTLKSEGFPIQFISKWHAQVGWLHIWIAAGRWHNIATGKRGRINKRMMRELIAPIFEQLIERGCHLFPEREHRAKQERRSHQEFVMQHKEYVNALISWRGRSEPIPL
jgi:hypothetical protein